MLLQQFQQIRGMKDSRALRNVSAPHETLTRVSLEVCAVMAVKGDWSGSGTSMVKGRGRVVHKSRPPKRKTEGKKQKKGDIKIS
jgi:hypothetical protein